MKYDLYVLTNNGSTATYHGSVNDYDEAELLANSMRSKGYEVSVIARGNVEPDFMADFETTLVL